MVVATGVIVTVPVDCTVPMPGSIVIVVASATFQVSIAVSLVLMVVGLARNETMLGGVDGYGE